LPTPAFNEVTYKAAKLHLRLPYYIQGLKGVPPYYNWWGEDGKERGGILTGGKGRGEVIS